MYYFVHPHTKAVFISPRKRSLLRYISRFSILCDESTIKKADDDTLLVADGRSLLAYNVEQKKETR